MKVPEKYYDEIFEFNGLWDVVSKCGLKIIDKGGKKTVIVTELYQDNPGTSVRNTSFAFSEVRLISGHPADPGENEEAA